MNVSESAPILPPEAAREVIPDVATALYLGADVIANYKDGDGFHVSIGEESWHLSEKDFSLAHKIFKVCELDYEVRTVSSAMDALKIRRRAVKLLEPELEDAPLKRVAMLKDKGSSGWWRMVLPGRHMDVDGWDIDCTAAPVDYDHLLEYDTVFVQRIHDWESYYMLEKLRSAGLKIVYDIDDDLFNITPDNPAYHEITRDDQLAAANCMKLADVVTTTTDELRRRLMGVLDGVNPVVVPNAWDVDDGWSHSIGSPDGFKRILWSGGASHAKDWEECFEAVSEIIQERDNVRLMILGFLPPCIEKSVNLPHFRNRIEFCGFRDPETYYNLIHHVRADVGLAPVCSTNFNAAKSPIKFLEYSLIGVPTVASNWLPYKAEIDTLAPDLKSLTELDTYKPKGMLVSGKDQWKSSMEFLLDNPDAGKLMVGYARDHCRERFDLKRVSEKWGEILCGDG
jgi:glycosyltransferase involved in cell wall biosynthesis